MRIINCKHRITIYIILFLFFLQNCSLKESNKSHGINFLENREKILVINKTNQNYVINLIGNPHTISLSDENTWVYFERTLTKGEFLKLGKKVLKTNNVLILSFDKYGILKDKNFLDKSSKNDITFSEKTTENNLKQKSFVERFLSSLRNKMYGRK